MRQKTPVENRIGEMVKFWTKSKLSKKCETAKTNSTFKQALGLLISNKLIEVKSNLEFTNYFPPKSPTPNEIRSENASEILIYTEKAELIHEQMRNSPDELKEFFQILFQDTKLSVIQYH